MRLHPSMACCFAGCVSGMRGVTIASARRINAPSGPELSISACSFRNVASRAPPFWCSCSSAACDLSLQRDGATRQVRW